MTKLTCLTLGLTLIAGTALGQARQEPTPAETLPVEEPRIEIFDIADLVREAAEREIDWKDLDAEDRASALENRAERLAELLAVFVQPALIEGREDIEVLGHSSLVARVRLAQRDWLQDRLDDYRLQSDRLIVMEWRSVRLDRGRAAGLGLRPGIQIVEELELLLAEMKSADVLQAPRVVTYNGQRAEISVLAETAYIKDYEVYENVGPYGERIVDPIVEVVKDGVVFECQALIVAENAIGLSFATTRSDVEHPIETRETELGPTGVPVVNESRTESRCTLAPGQSVVMLSQEGRDRDIVEILHVDFLE